MDLCGYGERKWKLLTQVGNGKCGSLLAWENANYAFHAFLHAYGISWKKLPEGSAKMQIANRKP